MWIWVGGFLYFDVCFPRHVDLDWPCHLHPSTVLIWFWFCRNRNRQIYMISCGEGDTKKPNGCLDKSLKCVWFFFYNWLLCWLSDDHYFLPAENVSLVRLMHGPVQTAARWLMSPTDRNRSDETQQPPTRCDERLNKSEMFRSDTLQVGVSLRIKRACYETGDIAVSDEFVCSNGAESRSDTCSAK